MAFKIQLSFQQLEQHKIKNSYKFHVDSTGEVTAPNDWYNSYLEIDVEVNKKQMVQLTPLLIISLLHQMLIQSLES